MRRKKKVAWGLAPFIPLALFAVVIVFTFFSPTSALKTASVQAAGNGTNYAWSENIGWISFDCANENVCGSSNYKVSEDASGNLSGYAWSENIGWISFNSGDVSACPSGSCAPNVGLSNGTVTGWARACGSFNITSPGGGACSGSQSSAGGWQGWIHLGGKSADNEGYGITQSNDSCAWTGWAWGGGNSAADGVIGWIHFNGTGYQASIFDSGSGCSNNLSATSDATLSIAPASGWADSANPGAIRNPGGSNDVSITLTTHNIANCDTSIAGGDSPVAITSSDFSNTNTTQTAQKNATATNGGSVVKPYTFSITCVGNDGVSHSPQASISVAGITGSGAGCKIDNFSASPSKVKKGTNSTLSWQTESCTACTIISPDTSQTTSLPYSVPSPDVNNSGTNPKSTDPIQRKTTFTLSCNDASSNTSASLSTQVDIQPTIIEI